MPELSYSLTPIYSSTYTLPNWSSFNFSAPSVTIPTVPSYTPITVPALPTLPTLYSIIGTNNPADIYIPYVPPAVTTYDPKIYALEQQAITLQEDLSNALFDLSIGYQLATKNRQTLVDYNTQLSTLNSQLVTKRNELTSLQTTLNSNASSLQTAVTDYNSKVNLLTSDTLGIFNCGVMYARTFLFPHADLLIDLHASQLEFV